MGSAQASQGLLMIIAMLPALTFAILQDSSLETETKEAIYFANHFHDLIFHYPSHITSSILELVFYTDELSLSAFTSFVAVFP